MSQKGNVALAAAAVVISVLVALGAGEAILRVKNSSMRNYDIEMWRYAKELKKLDSDPALAFDHVPGRSATLQSVDIRINEKGLRGGPVPPVQQGGRRILFLGASITLGWGVAEADTTVERIAAMFREAGEPATVLNGGVGNYNTSRYVSRFFRKLEDLQPTDIVVQYFLRDAENLGQNDENLLLRHSELAVTLWIAYHRLFDKKGESSLLEHYQGVYTQTAPGFLVMREKLKELAEYARAHNIRLYFVMTPDIHNLVDYKFSFVHDTMHSVATGLGYTYLDLLPSLSGRTPESLYAMPGDPHPNALGHKIMAEAIFPVLRQTAPAKP